MLATDNVGFYMRRLLTVCIGVVQYGWPTAVELGRLADGETQQPQECHQCVVDITQRTCTSALYLPFYVPVCMCLTNNDVAT